MDFLKDDVKPVYFKYLKAAFGSAMITSIYSIVDMAVVGQYEGTLGTAALAVVAPIWNIIYSLGLLMGIGGSVIFSTLKGQNNSDDSNKYFTSSIIGSIILSIITWILFVVFEKQILIFFGADETLLSLAYEYLRPIKVILPLYLFNQMLAAFIRNDNNPNLATIGVLSGGLFNCVGDYAFVFIFKMGIYGAGLATSIGSLISFIVMVTHFFNERCSLKFVKTDKLFCKLKEITVTGFSTFFIDVAMGILTILFNKQIMKYLGSDALSIYGPIINISTFAQCCAYSVGQASQPIISMNFGAKQYERIKEVLSLALKTCLVFGLFWTLLSLIYPNLYIYMFMKPTENILKIAPSIIRRYGISFLILPFNIFSTYFFQAISKPNIAFVVSVLRGLVISGILIYALPVIFNGNAIWLTMSITELLVVVYASIMMKKCVDMLK